MTMPYVIIGATALPLLLYMAVGFWPGSRSRNVEDYFIYGQTVSTSDYANTSVSYAMQMAAVFLFSYWAGLYGLGALWTPLFWGLGFWLLLVLLPKFLPFHTRGSTMHKYLADSFGGPRNLQRTLQLLAAGATVVGLWGTMMAEVDYTIQIYSPIFTTTKSQYVLGSFFLIFGLIYIVFNGYKAEVNTARFQVPIEYLGFIFVLLLVLPTVWIHSGHSAFWVIWWLLFVIFVILLLGKLMIGWRRAIRDPQTLIPLVGFAALAIVVPYVHRLVAGHQASVLNLPPKQQLYAQGPLGLFSLLLANALWMPVDLSTWQRISSVKGTADELLHSLRKGTRRVLFESPATWMLGVALGLTISTGGFLGNANPSQGLLLFSSALASRSMTSYLPGLLASLAYPVFIVACLSVMLSTVHSIISAISFTAYNDLLPPNRPSLTAARVCTIILVLLGMAVYPYLRITLGASLPTILYGAYSAQLSLFVIAMLALLKKRLNSIAAIASILFGFVATGLSVYLALKVTDPDAAVLPPIFALLAAIIGYVIFFRVRRSTRSSTFEKGRS